MPQKKIGSKPKNAKRLRVIDKERHGRWVSHKGVLSGPDMYFRLRLPIGDSARLDITPLVKEAVQEASLDVRLGNWFTVARRTKLKAVELGKKLDEQQLMIGREESFVPNDKSFLIHPGDLVLGSTLEFVGLPGDLMAFVEGKSSLG